MIDREKVIKGFEHCIEKLETVVNKAHGFNCTTCPYFRKCDRSGYLIGLPLMRDALALLKAQEPCMDAVSREAVLDLAQTYGPATYDMPYGSGDMIIRPEDVKTLPSVQPIPLARVLTLEEIDGNPEHRKEYFVEFNYYQEYMDDSGYCRVSANSDGIMVTIWMAKHVLTEDMRDYNKTWRCWTSKPTDEQRKKTPWEGR